MTFGENISRLRKECGLSHADLAKATGIDKKSIIRHSQDRIRPRPSTLQCYASTFSEKLGREVTVAELEGK